MAEKKPEKVSEEQAAVNAAFTDARAGIISSQGKLGQAWATFAARQEAFNILQAPTNSDNLREALQNAELILESIWTLEFRAQEYKDTLAALMALEEKVSLKEGKDLPE